jgi:hypothetical protein
MERLSSLTAAVPRLGWMMLWIVRASPSLSLSLASTAMAPVDPLAAVVALSFCVIGALLPPAIVTLTVWVAVPPCPSLTV